MSIEHFFPSEDIKIQTPLSIGVSHADAMVWRTPFGPAGGRNWAEYPVHSLKVALGEHGASTDKIRALNWWDHHIGGVTYPFWLLEDVSREHRGVICGPERGDGTRTVFVVPLEAAGTVNAVFVDGVWQDPSTYSIVSGNLVADNEQANGEDGVTGLTAEGDGGIALASVDYLARLGRSAIKCTFTGTPSVNSGVKVAEITGLTAEVNYTLAASFYLSGSDTDVRIAAIWRDGAGNIATDTASSTGNSQGTWIDVQDTFESASIAGGDARDADRVLLYALKEDGSGFSDDTFFVGGISFYEGDANDVPKVFLPSYAPKFIVFDTAPTDGQRIMADITGKRCWYGMREKDIHTYTIIDAGVQKIAGFKLTEVIPL